MRGICVFAWAPSHVILRALSTLLADSCDVF